MSISYIRYSITHLEHTSGFVGNCLGLYINQPEGTRTERVVQTGSGADALPGYTIYGFTPKVEQQYGQRVQGQSGSWHAADTDHQGTERAYAEPLRAHNAYCLNRSYGGLASRLCFWGLLIRGPVSLPNRQRHERRRQRLQHPASANATATSRRHLNLSRGFWAGGVSLVLRDLGRSDQIRLGVQNTQVCASDVVALKCSPSYDPDKTALVPDYGFAFLSDGLQN